MNSLKWLIGYHSSPRRRILGTKSLVSQLPISTHYLDCKHSDSRQRRHTLHSIHSAHHLRQARSPYLPYYQRHSVLRSLAKDPTSLISKTSSELRGMRTPPSAPRTTDLKTSKSRPSTMVARKRKSAHWTNGLSIIEGYSGRQGRTRGLWSSYSTWHGMRLRC